MSAYAAFLPGNVSKHPGRFLGPTIAATFVQGIEAGILINQSLRFWARSGEQHWTVKALVAFVSIAAAVQTAISFYNTWYIFVENFGDWVATVDLLWPTRLQPAMNGILAAPVQGYLIWRCWNTLKRRWKLAVVPLVLLWLATIVANSVITQRIFAFDVVKAFLNPSTHLPYEFITAFVLSAVLDVFITTIMLWFLLGVRSQIKSHQADMVVRHLLRTLWEAAVPPCVCAIVACAVYIKQSQENLWSIFYQSILGKLYVMSLLVILNGKEDLKRSPATASYITPTNNLTRNRNTIATEVHIQTTTVVEDDASKECFELVEPSMLRRNTSLAYKTTLPPVPSERDSSGSWGDKVPSGDEHV